MISVPTLIYRRIDPATDADRILAHHRDACIASYGNDRRFHAASCLNWLRAKVDEYPDGCVLALLDGQCIGHMELQVPYGLTIGYVNLYYVSEPFRGQGFGTLMHAYAERYFRSWEATRIQLHVAPRNRPALNLYRKLGYRFVKSEPDGLPLWLMTKKLAPPHDARSN